MSAPEPRTVHDEPECVVSTTREQNREYDAYWVECVASHDHDCTTEPRLMVKINREAS